MADVRKTIEIVFGAVDQTASGIGSVARGIDDFTGSISKATGPLSDLGDKALKAEAAIVGVAAAMLAASINEAGKFGDAVNEIGTLTTMSGQQLVRYGQDLLDYSRNSTQSLDAITAATYSAISAGIDYTDAIGSLAAAERLAVAGKADLNAATVLLASSLNAYGRSAEDASRFSDILFTTVRMGQTTIPELASSLAQVTSIAAAADVPFETLNAAIAALTASGMPTSQAITSIKAAISNILAPSKQASDLAAELGIEFNATALKTKGFEGVLRDVQHVTGGNIEQMAKLFGSVQGLAAATSLAADQSGVFRGALDAMTNSAGATEAAYAKMADNFALTNQRLINNLRATLVEAGTPLLDDYRSVANSLGEVFASLSIGLRSDAFKPVFDAIEEAAGGIATYLEGIARALPDAFSRVNFADFAASFVGLGDSIRGLFGDLDLTKPEDLARVLQFVVDSATSLTIVVRGMVDAWRPALQTIVEAIDRFNSLSDGAKLATGETLGFAQVFEKVVSPIVGGVTGAIEGLSAAVTGLAVVMGGNALLNAGKLAGVLGAGAGAAGLVGAAGAGGYALGTVLNPAIDGLVSKLTGSQTTLGSWIYDLIHGKREAELFGDGVGRSASGVERLDEAIAQADIGGVTQDARNAGQAFDAMAAGLDGIAGAVSKVVIGPVTNYLDAMGNVVHTTIESRDALDEWNRALLTLDGVMGPAGANMSTFADETALTGDALKRAREEAGLGTPVYDALTGAFLGYEQIVRSAGKSTDESSRSIGKITEESRRAEEAVKRWNEEVARMDHAEKLAIIQSHTAITTARIESDTRKMVAAYESLNVAIQSTGETLVGLFGILASGDLSLRQIFDLEAEIRRESQRRDQALAKQNELLDAQIKEIKERTEAIQRGDALIKIEGDGLAPHLEAFMWEILRAIQVRVNQDGYEMLMGA